MYLIQVFWIAYNHNLIHLCCHSTHCESRLNCLISNSYFFLNIGPFHILYDFDLTTINTSTTWTTCDQNMLITT